MDFDKFIELSCAGQWAQIPKVGIGKVSTMLSPGEQQMLHYLGRLIKFEGCIVDAGAFMGGSTIALASGLALNSTRSTIHSYDMFIAPNDRYSLNLIGHNKKPGDDVMDIVKSGLSNYLDFIEFHAGDFVNAEPPNCPIDLLFIDIAKTWELNTKLTTRFFPLLRPGRSIVVQQDFNHHGAPWTNIAMQLFGDYFDSLFDVRSSRVFRYKSAIPSGLLNTDLKLLPYQKKLDLIEASAIDTKYASAQFSCRVSKAWIIFEEEGHESAIKYLDEMQPHQPWEGGSYTDSVKVAIMALGDIQGRDNYHRNYFLKPTT